MVGMLIMKQICELLWLWVQMPEADGAANPASLNFFI